MPVKISTLDDLIRAVSLRISLDPETRNTRAFKTFQEAKEFFEHEVEFWKPHAGDELAQVYGSFTFVLGALNQAAQASSEEPARQNINRAAKRLQDQPFGFVCSQIPFAHFLKTLATENPELIRGAMAYRDGTFAQQPLNKSRDVLEGILATIAFRHPEFFLSGLDARVKAFDCRNSKAEMVVGNLVTQSKMFHDEMTEWRKVTQAELSEITQSATASFSQTTTEWTETFKNAHATAEKELASICNAFHEQMRLKEPAQYWQDLEREYTKKGRIWTGISSATVAALAVAVAMLVYRPPTLFLENRATLGGIKGALLIAAGISMIVYLINLFVRMSTSAYHLARDAKERFQLTHVFLALIKDQVIEPKDRDIVLSALFSRADTGLLQGDSSPTMPTPLASVMEALKGR